MSTPNQARIKCEKLVKVLLESEKPIIGPQDLMNHLMLNCEILAISTVKVNKLIPTYF